MGKTLYLECYSGISGDMTVGALLDLGASREVLESALASLGVGGYHLHFGRTKKCGIDAYDFDVHLEEAGHGHHHGEGESHGHHHDGAEGVHVHHHAHVHRNLHDIYDVIGRLDSSEKVKETARRIFGIVAEAESKAHGVPVEEVHFHEVGAIDSIVDIIGTAVCLEDLGIDQVIVSPLSEGRGHVRCQHGIMPVPVPATANIAAAYDLELRLTDQEGEMVTPTGAAIAAALKSGRNLPEHYRITGIGVGAGKKDFENANILRAMLIEPAAEKPAERAGGEMWVLETNIDDCGGEALGYTMECLLESGAADVWFVPVYMKKNRPACQLSVLCREDQIKAMEEVILTQTTTIGLRRYPVERTVMERRAAVVSTRYGEVEVKVCATSGGRTFCYPEYESVRKICKESGMDYKSVYHEAAEQAALCFRGKGL